MSYLTVYFKKKLGLTSLVVLASLVHPQEGFATEHENNGGEQLVSKKTHTTTTTQAKEGHSLNLGQYLTLEDVDNLIVAAKENNVEAQNKLMDLYGSGAYRSYLTPEKIGFLDWKTQGLNESILTRCALNDSYAFYFIVNFLKIRKKFLEEEIQNLVTQIRKRAEQGYAAAQSNLGLIYFEGQMVKKDKNEVFRLYKLAIEQNDPIAQNSLGVIYEFGEDVEKDEKEACRLYKLSATQGHAVAQHNLGLKYEFGKGVEKDEKEACRLYELAANQGYAPAQFNLGLILYLKDQDVESGSFLFSGYMQHRTF